MGKNEHWNEYLGKCKVYLFVPFCHFSLFLYKLHTCLKTLRVPSFREACLWGGGAQSKGPLLPEGSLLGLMPG